MLTDFYSYSNWQSTDNELSCQLSYNAAHPIFAGHFPQQPVVPGVCTMQIVKELLEKAIGSKLMLTSAAQVKFLQLQLPDTQPVITISWKKDGETIKASTTITAEAAVFKMQSSYRA